ncbi:MAG: hypothetical protein R3C68_17405 [Myxococcota bacterium]
MAFGDLLIQSVGFGGTFGLSMKQLNAAVEKNQEYTEQEMAASMKGMEVSFNSLSAYLYDYVTFESCFAN